MRVLAALALAACGGAGSVTASDAAPVDARSGPLMVYVGGSDDQIHAFTLDEQTLALTPAGSFPTGAGPSFLAFDGSARFLVAVNEGADMVESFAIGADGALTHVDQASSSGAGPAHVAVVDGWTMVANYGDGTAAVLPISADGHFGAATATVAPGANAHEIVPVGDTVYIPCLGANLIAVYGFSAGALTARSTTPLAGGPRHIAFAPDRAHAWVIDETASTLTTFAVGADGALTARGTVSSRAPGATGSNTGAEIAVDPSGAWIVASNRGDDDLAVFAIGADGALTPTSFQPTGGATPRHFSFASGAAVLVANQGSDTITGFGFDAATGALTPVGELASVPGPEFVGALRLP